MKKDFKMAFTPGGVYNQLAFRVPTNAASHIGLACHQHSIYKKIK